MEYLYNGPKTALDIVNYGALQANDTAEITKLVDICQKSGIFFLDLKNSQRPGHGYDDMPSVITAQREFFSQDKDLKLDYAIDHPSKGYDMSEELSVQRLKLSRKEQISGVLRLPPELQAVSDRISALFTFNDTVLRSVSQVLCNNISPPVSCTYADPANPGASNLCLGLASARAGTAILGNHLDEDILSITYYDEPFLEVQDRKTGQWGLVEVNEHMPIVNVGEELMKASESRYYAPPHRVIQSPNEINLIMYDLNEGSRQNAIAVA